MDTPDNEEWFLHFEQKGVYGRIVHLQPVKWENGWPMIGIDNNGDGIGEPVIVHPKPSETAGFAIYEPEASDFFETEQLKLQWQWMANYKDSFYSFQEEKGKLCLYPMNTTKQEYPIVWNSANVLTQKIVCPEFTVETKMDVSQMMEGSRSGILLIGGQYAALYLERKTDGLHLSFVESKGDGESREEEIVNLCKNIQETTLYLRITFSKKETGKFFYSFNGQQYKSVAKEFSPLGAVWVGAKVGLFALSNAKKIDSNKVFFDYFKMLPEIEEK